MINQSKIYVDTAEPRILAIVPAFNEEDSIESTIYDLRHNAPFVDILVINDGSSDSTEKRLEDLSVAHINLVKNLGIGGAVQTGYIYALQNNYDIAVQFDGDGQHDASYIRDLIQPIINGDADAVIGSRFIEEKDGFKSSFMRRTGINILSTVLKLASGNRIIDVTSGFRAVNKKAVELFANYYPDDYPEPEALAFLSRKGFRIAEVPVSMNERTGGSSSIKRLDSVYYMIKVTMAILIQTNIYERR